MVNISGTLSNKVGLIAASIFLIKNKPQDGDKCL